MKIGKFNIKSVYLVGVAIIVFIFALSFVFFMLQNDGNRRIFYFESMDKAGLFTEIRYLASGSENPSLEENIKQFCNEILLGPATHRFKKLFASGTRVEDCFFRNEVLYLNLSKDVLNSEKGTSSIKRGAEILEKNIQRNFPKVKKTEIYINSVKAYDETLPFLSN